MKRAKLGSLSLLLLYIISALIFCKSVNAQTTTPFTPHDISVLIIYDSTADSGSTGYGSLIVEFARYGFNVTLLPCNTGDIDFTTYPQSANINQYDVVVIQSGNANDQPTKVTTAEVNYFCKTFGGLLILTASSLMCNQSTNDYWGWNHPNTQTIETRLGVDFTGWESPANATLYRKTTTIPNLPSTLDLTVPAPTIGSQKGSVTSATMIYNYTSTFSIGISYYSNASGAKAIFINNQWVLASEPALYHYKWWGIGNDGVTTEGFGDNGLSQRAEVLARMISYAFGMDFNTLIKPQPLANFRIDDMGSTNAPWATDAYQLTCMQNIQKTLDEIGVSKISICPIYWFNDAHNWDELPNFAEYSLARKDSWEWVNHFNHFLTTDTYLTASTEEHQRLIAETNQNATNLGFHKPPQFFVGRGDYSPNAWEAMRNEGYWFSSILVDYYDNITGDSTRDDFPYTLQPIINYTYGIFIHGRSMSYLTGRNMPNFTQWGKQDIWKYYLTTYNRRVIDTLMAIDTFSQPLDHWENWYSDEVGPWAFKTYYWNLTNDLPDLKWVWSSEATNVVAGNKYAKLSNASRTDSTISFTVNIDNVPTLTTIGKGMLWYRISADETIQSVTINGQNWYGFDDYSIRIPASNCEVSIKLGTSRSPKIVETNAQITTSSFVDNAKMTLTINGISGTESTTKIYVSALGKPERISGTSSWSYNNETQLVIVNVIQSGEQAIEIDWHEPNPPTTTAHLNGKNGKDGWFNSNVTVSLNATDDLSGVDKTQYSLDNTTWVDYVDPFIISNEGTTEIWYKSTDKDGNTEAPKTEIIKIDQTCPFGSIKINNASSYARTSSVLLFLAADDKVSGIEAMRLSNDNQTFTHWQPFTSSYLWPLQGGDGFKTIYAQFKDNSGLYSPIYQGTIILDSTPPRADAGTNRTVDEDTMTTFDASSSRDENGIICYQWSFTDVTLQTLKGEKPSHVFNTPGVYEITLNVTDAAGNWATKTISISVLDITKPVAKAEHSQTVRVGAPLICNASGSTDNVGIVSYKWDFGDNITGSGRIVSHTYEKTGKYVLVLTVKDAEGNSDTRQAIVEVLPTERLVSVEDVQLVVIGAIVGALLVATLVAVARRKRLLRKPIMHVKSIRSHLR